MKKSILLILLAFALGCYGEMAEAPQQSSSRNQPGRVLRFSAIPDQNTTELKEKFQPLADHLTQKLGVPVEYVPARDYQATVEMFRNGDIQLAWFGGLTGVQARAKVPGAMAIAQGSADPNYYSYFITHRSTGLKKSDKFPMEIGKYRFTFGSESSTSGRLMPEYFIREHTGKSPEEFFKEPVSFSGSHDKTAELVASGQYQVGVINYKVYDQRVRDGKTDPKVVRIIWQTPPYADYNWTVRPDLDQQLGVGFTENLQRTLIEINDPTLLAALPRDKLIKASNEQYEGIRQVAEQLKMLR